MKNKIYAKAQASLLMLALSMATALSACQQSYHVAPLAEGSNLGQGIAAPSLASGTGNGVGFEGRVVVNSYAHLDPMQPCSDKGPSGQVLSNRQIFLVSDGASQVAVLVRDACRDLAKPASLNMSDLAFSGGPAGTVTYQNNQFQSVKAGSDFDVIAAGCPAGKTPKSGAVRTNLLQDSQNLIGPSWASMSGILAQLSGSAAGLPLFNLSRNDSGNLDTWRRQEQVVNLVPAKSYAYTFFATAGSVGSAEMNASDYPGNAFVLSVSFDLATGISTTRQNTGALNVSSSSQAFAGGYMNTVYFTTPGGAASNHIGVMPYRNSASGDAFGQLGDSVNVSAVQLEDVAGFCN